MAELDGGRITAVFTADTAVDLGTYALALLDSHIHQLAHTVLVKTCKRVVLEYLSLVICLKELACIIT